jgi:hypothetical protein
VTRAQSRANAASAAVAKSTSWLVNPPALWVVSEMLTRL